MPFLRVADGGYISLDAVVSIDPGDPKSSHRSVRLNTGEAYQVDRYELEVVMLAGGHMVPAPAGYQLIDSSGGPDALYLMPILAFYVTPEMTVLPVSPEGVRLELDYMILQADGKVCGPGGEPVHASIDGYRADLRETTPT